VTVIWRAAALADVARIARHIAAENPIAARKMARELLAGDSLVLFPRRRRPGREPGTRELVPVSPYVLVYEIAADGSGAILSLAVLRTEVARSM
jgi:toxin ParE1/3/4